MYVPGLEDKGFALNTHRGAESALLPGATTHLLPSRRRDQQSARAFAMRLGHRYAPDHHPHPPTEGEWTCPPNVPPKP